MTGTPGSSRPDEWLPVATAALAGRRLLVMTGAGISTDSGIPDYRGPQGVWTKNPGAERSATIQAYLADPALRRRSWQTRLASPMWAAQPGPGHRALVALERAGLLAALVTQNVDGLHERAGTDPARLLEVHGSVWRWACWDCGATGPMEETLDRVRAGEEDPPCLRCGGILKSATISFGQNLDPDVLEAAGEAARRAEGVLVIGTTLSVYPAAALVPLAARVGAPVVIVNADPTDYDDLAEAVVRVPIGEAVPALVEALVAAGAS